MDLIFYQSKSDDPWWNQSLERYLAEHAGKEDLIFYLWQNNDTVFIGRNQNPLLECRTRELEESGGRLARRTTGGGAVYHDMGNLCFSFIASSGTYDQKLQMEVIREACRKLNVETYLSGKNDMITAEGYKFSGNAFSISSGSCIHHGTLMIDVDTERMSEVLTPSGIKLQGKGVSSVRSRVCNLRRLNPDITVASMCEALTLSLKEQFGAYRVLDEEELNRSELQEMYGQFSSWDWRYGKTPECSSFSEHRFDWGEVRISIELENMRIREAVIYTDAMDVELPELLRRSLIGKKMDPDEIRDSIPDKISGEQAGQLRQVAEWLAEEI